MFSREGEGRGDYNVCDVFAIFNCTSYRLQYLPVTLAHCHLTALWLSENQSKPLLNLQRDVTDEGEEVFTCYMLPQQAYHTESMGERKIDKLIDI